MQTWYKIASKQFTTRLNEKPHKRLLTKTVISHAMALFVGCKTSPPWRWREGGVKVALATRSLHHSSRHKSDEQNSAWHDDAVTCDVFLSAWYWHSDQICVVRLLKLIYKFNLIFLQQIRVKDDQTTCKAMNYV